MLKEAIAASREGIATAHERAAFMFKQTPESLAGEDDGDRRLAAAYQAESEAHAKAADLWRKATSPTLMAEAAKASEAARLLALETDATEVLVEEDIRADEAEEAGAAKFEGRVQRVEETLNKEGARVEA